MEQLYLAYPNRLFLIWVNIGLQSNLLLEYSLKMWIAHIEILDVYSLCAELHLFAFF